MCDHKHYDDLESRVDAMENRLTAVETTITDFRGECRDNFKDMKTELNMIYGERAKWSEWARNNIGTAIRWLGYIVLTACGINQASSIIETCAKLFFQ